MKGPITTRPTKAGKGKRRSQRKENAKRAAARGNTPSNKVGVDLNCLSLRALMQEGNLTQQGLADRCDVKVRTVQLWLSGAVRPSVSNFDTLCLVLGVEPEILRMSSQELLERARTLRVVRFHNREMLGKNNAPDYDEARRIELDLQDAEERNAQEEEVKEADITVFSENLSHSDSEPNAEEGDDE